MTTGLSTEKESIRLARILRARVDSLVDTWENLGNVGPTMGSAAAGSSGSARQRYLGPLAYLLVGGLAGSRDSAAVYLDERLRYVDAGLSAAGRRSLLERNLAIEEAAICATMSDVIDPSITAEILADLHAPLIRDQPAKIKLLFIGDCLFVETRAFLAPEMRQRDCPVDISHVFFSAGQQTGQINTAVVNEIECWRPDVIGISLFTFEGIPLYRAAWRSAAAPFGARRAYQLIDGLVGTLQALVDDIRAVSQAPIVIHAPAGLPLDPIRRRIPVLGSHSRGQRQLLSRLGRRIAELTEGTVNTILLQESQVVDRAGGVQTLARPLFDTTEVPAGYSHTSRLGPEIATEYAAVLTDYDLLGAAKVLLVDFDNTLWRGVMAEGQVEHYPDRQQLLLDLRSAGVLLVAVSKNDPNSIRWDEMLLSENDFALTKINWRAKPDNVIEAISELDLAANAFVMIDDNPVERALVEDHVPGVRTLDGNDQQAWRTLRNWLNFPSTAQTDEARRRTEMYREAASRRAAMNQVTDYATMMRSLKLKHSVRPGEQRDIDRIMELVQRTNQFNTTTHRRSLSEIQDLLQSEDTGVYVASLSDRFGDLGIVAVAIFERNNRLFESVIMSCRAMGFGLEIALLRAVMDAEGGQRPFFGTFIPTDRNKPAADLYERAGFKPLGDGRWELAVGASLPEVPTWLT